MSQGHLTMLRMPMFAREKRVAVSLRLIALRDRVNQNSSPIGQFKVSLRESPDVFLSMLNIKIIPEVLFELTNRSRVF